jgi:NAD(P)-dependent dehydrogenase (short-subunit alcohol dehydrogenase family)
LTATAKEFPSPKPHLSIVTSDLHAFTRFPERKAKNTFAALDKSGETSMRNRYPTSKLLEVLVVRELAPKLADSGIVLNMLTPGLCKSQLSREEGLAFRLMVSLFGRSAEVGSRTLLAAASVGPESHGAYLLDGKVNNMALSSFVRGEAGFEAQKKVWNELNEILEEIHPGITRYLGVPEGDREPNGEA